MDITQSLNGIREQLEQNKRIVDYKLESSTFQGNTIPNRLFSILDFTSSYLQLARR